MQNFTANNIKVIEPTIELKLTIVNIDPRFQVGPRCSRTFKNRMMVLGQRRAAR